MARLVEQAKKKSKAQNLRLARALISKTRWLDQYPHYRKGRIEFIDTNQKKYELNSYLVSKTQRTINQIRKFGSLAGELLEEDLNAWLAKKESQLENAKKLVKTLEVPYPTKIESEESIAALLAYLEIESQCLLEEEMAVSTRLFKHKEISFPLLFEYIREYHHSPNSKALASLILGAIHREQQKKLKPSFERLEENKWIQDCYSFGLKHSLPSYIVLASRILKTKNGKAILEFIESLLKREGGISFSQYQLMTLLHAGLTPEELLNLLRDSKELNKSILFLEEIDPSVRKKKIIAAHQNAIENLKKELSNWIISSQSPRSADQLNVLIKAVLKSGGTRFTSLEIILSVLKEGSVLGRRERSAWLDIIAENSECLFYTEIAEESSTLYLRHRIGGKGSSKLKEALRIYQQSEDALLTGDTIKYWLSSSLIVNNVTDSNLIRLLLSWAKKLDFNRLCNPDDFVLFVRSLGTADSARKKMEPLVEAINRTAIENREHLFNNIFENLVKHEFRSADLKSFSLMIPSIEQFLLREIHNNCPCWLLTQLCLQILSSNCARKEDLAGCIFEFYRKRGPFNYYQNDAILIATRISLMVIEFLDREIFDSEYVKCKQIKSDRIKLLDEILEAFFLTATADEKTYGASAFREEGLHSLKSHPEILIILVNKVISSPRRAVSLFENLGIIQRFDASAKNRLFKLKRFRKIKVTPGSIKTMVSKGWKPVIDKVPDMKPLILSFIMARSLTGEDQSPPPSLLKILLQEEGLKTELEYLELAIKKDKTNRFMKSRIENLRTRISNKEEIEKNIKTRLSRHLFFIVEEAEQEALNAAIQEAFKYQLKKITGVLPEKIQFNSYMRNALLMTQDIDENKRLLKKIIRSTISGEDDFRLKIQGNKFFLDFLKDANISSQNWLAAHPRNYTAKNIPGSKVHIKLECDPIKILEMGNYFDTCLSFGGENSFSTVTNACDLNKRVLYAFDARGNVIGRKLIALTMEGKLVGFNAYTSLETKEGRKELRKFISQYIKEFVLNCGVTLANEGTVAPLSSRHWYDDGIVEWGRTPLNISSKKNSSAHHHSKDQSM